MSQLVLASGSPRRRQLLEALAVPHQVLVSKVEERIPQGMTPAEAAMSLAYQKAADVAARLREGIVIGADTIVVLDGRILGKPRDGAEAVEMLTALNGRAHKVITGLTLIDAGKDQVVQSVEETEVIFKNISQEEIQLYVDSGEPLDKAGAYGIQGLGGLFVKEIKGCYFNVVGLPLALLYEILKDLKVDIFQIRLANKGV